MPDDTRLRQAALLALWDLQEAVDEDDLEAAQKCREKRLLLALELFSADRKRHGALEQVWMSVEDGCVTDDAEPVREALKRAIPLFEH
jgi:hypothetical protein